MRSAWLSFQVTIALAWRALLIDLSNFHLIHYRKVSGFLVSGKNSGTHWLRHMLSHAMAKRYDLPPPAYSSGRESEDFVGHPRWPRKHARLPYIAGSHNLPSMALAWPWVRRLFHLPPIVVLVRDPKEAMLSHYLKWREPLALSLQDYIHRPSTKRRQLANAWWYIDFFNRWGRMAETAPDLVLVVRYEDLQAAPAFWLERISDHLGLGLDSACIDAGIAVSSREAVRSTLDPAYGEEIVSDAGARARIRFSSADDAVVSAQFDAHMRRDFGYGHARQSNRPSASPVGARGLVWARTAFLLSLAYAAFNQIGRPYFNLGLAEPWSRLELTTVFSLLTLLGPQSFPRLKAAVPALLSIGGGAIELAQHARLAPGTGSMLDLTAEIAGIALASAIMTITATRGFGGGEAQANPLSSPQSSSAVRAAEARPAPRPG